jgi:hypothetical protein
MKYLDFKLEKQNFRLETSFFNKDFILEIGYGEDIGQIFSGDMLSVRHRKEEGNIITKLSAGDGLNTIQKSRTNKAYAKGTPVKNIFKDLGGGSLEKDMPETKLDFALMSSGQSLKKLNQLLNPQGFRAFMEDGRLNILKKGEAIQKEALILSDKNGLLLECEMAPENKVNLKTLTLPELNLGRKIYIESVAFTGFVIIEKIRFSGDNFGGTWEADVEAII